MAKEPAQGGITPPPEPTKVLPVAPGLKHYTDGDGGAASLPDISGTNHTLVNKPAWGDTTKPAPPSKLPKGGDDGLAGLPDMTPGFNGKSPASIGGTGLLPTAQGGGAGGGVEEPEPEEEEPDGEG